MSENERSGDVTALTVQLLSAYLANNTVASDELAGLIRSTREALTEEPQASAAEPEEQEYTPAVSVRKSLSSPEHIISLIDGRPYKTLKRHLAGHGLTPESYRARYNLPVSYPMVAPNFAAKRREIAEKIGLGNRRGRGAQSEKPGLGEAVAAETASAPAAQDGVDTSSAGNTAAAKPKSSAGRARANSTRKSTSKGSRPEALTPQAEQAGEAAHETQPAPQAPSRKARPRKEKARAKAEIGSAGASTEPAEVAEAGATAGEPKNAATTDHDAGGRVADDTTEAGSAQTPSPKRRGKLGMFGRQADNGQAADGAGGKADDEGSGAAGTSAKKPAGNRRSSSSARRMARPQKSA